MQATNSDEILELDKSFLSYSFETGTLCKKVTQSSWMVSKQVNGKLTHNILFGIKCLSEHNYHYIFDLNSRLYQLYQAELVHTHL